MNPDVEWSTREKLAIASYVLSTGDQHWCGSVSRLLRPLGEPNRPIDWFSPKNCAQQYTALLEAAETTRRKRGGERSESTESYSSNSSQQQLSIQEIIVRKLTQERVDEIKKQIRAEKIKYRKLKQTADQIDSGELKEKFPEMIAAMEKEKETQQAASTKLQQQTAAVEQAADSDTVKKVTSELIGQDTQKPDSSTCPTIAGGLDDSTAGLSLPKTSSAEEISSKTPRVEDPLPTEKSAKSPGGTAERHEKFTLVTEEATPAQMLATPNEADTMDVDVDTVGTVSEIPSTANECWDKTPAPEDSAVTRDSTNTLESATEAECEQDSAAVLELAPDASGEESFCQDNTSATISTVDDHTNVQSEIPLINPPSDDERSDDVTGPPPTSPDLTQLAPELGDDDTQPAYDVTDDVVAHAEVDDATKSTVDVQQQRACDDDDAATTPPRKDDADEPRDDQPREEQADADVAHATCDATGDDGAGDSSGESAAREAEATDETAAEQPPPPASQPADDVDDDEGDVFAFRDDSASEVPAASLVDEQRASRHAFEDDDDDDAVTGGGATGDNVEDDAALPTAPIGSSSPGSLSLKTRNSEVSLSDSYSETKDDINQYDIMTQDYNRHTDDDDMMSTSSTSMGVAAYTEGGYPSSPALSCGSDMDLEQTAVYRAWKKSIVILWKQVASHRYASLFLQPVTDDIAPNYSNIIYRPMDLQTLKKNIETGAIRTTSEFQRDLMLMFQNALMYNNRGHDVYKMTLEMQEDVLDQVAQFLATQLMMETAHQSTPKGLRRSTLRKTVMSEQVSEARSKRAAAIEGELRLKKKSD